jgi:hypothetical protein
MFQALHQLMLLIGREFAANHRNKDVQEDHRAQEAVYDENYLQEWTTKDGRGKWSWGECRQAGTVITRGA